MLTTEQLILISGIVGFIGCLVYLKMKSYGVILFVVSAILMNVSLLKFMPNAQIQYYIVNLITTNILWISFMYLGPSFDIARNRSDELQTLRFGSLMVGVVLLIMLISCKQSTISHRGTSFPIDFGFIVYIIAISWFYHIDAKIHSKKYVYFSAATIVFAVFFIETNISIWTMSMNHVGIDVPMLIINNCKSIVAIGLAMAAYKISVKNIYPTCFYSKHGFIYVITIIYMVFISLYSFNVYAILGSVFLAFSFIQFIILQFGLTNMTSKLHTAFSAMAFLSGISLMNVFLSSPV